MALRGIGDNESCWLLPARLRLELLALLSTDPQHTPTVTYEQFMEWADEDTLAEWVDGKVIMTSPASMRHQDVATFLQHVLAQYTVLHGLGKVVIAPFQMKLAHSGREPDVLFLTTDHLDRLRESRVEGPCDVVVEVVSKESRGRDRGEKFYEYQEGGVPEYWLIDVEPEQAEFYRLDERGHYQLMDVGPDGVYRSAAVPGFWLRVDWLWRQPLPDPVQVLLEIDRDAYTRYLQQQIERTGS